MHDPPKSIRHPKKKSPNPDHPNRRVFPKIGVPKNGWFRMENSIRIDDLGVPLFLETSRSFHSQFPQRNHFHSTPPCTPKKFPEASALPPPLQRSKGNQKKNNSGQA